MRRIITLLALLFVLVPARSQNSNPSGNAQIYNGQQAVTGTAAALASQPLKTFCIKALHANTIAVYVGNSSVSTANGMELQADQSWCANIDNANRVYVVATTTGASVSWIGTN